MSRRSFQSDAVFVMGLYNIVMGAVFFFLHVQIFKLFGIESYLPAHAPTIQIPCLFLVVFGIGYLAACQNLARNHALLLVGLLQNAAVAGMAIWYKLDHPKLVHNVYLLPAGISALFAVMFLVAWVGAIVEAGRQRRRRRRAPVVVPRARAKARAAAAEPIEPEAPPEEVEPEPEPAEEIEPEAAEEMPEPREPETPSESAEPDEEPPIHPLSHRDRSGIPPE